MTRTELAQYILETYDAAADYPWLSYPDYQVFRHTDNQKWFALIMNVSKNKLGLEGTACLDVVNLKCDPIMISSVRNEPGIFPGYHMSKGNWVTLALDGSAADDTIRFLLDVSFTLTMKKTVKKKRTKS